MRDYHKRVTGRGMFDFQTFYRQVACELPAESKIVEVGVADGASAIFLAEALLDSGKRFEFTWVDDLSYGGKEQENTLRENIIKAGLASMVNLLVADSLGASCRFEDRSLDFVFIDSSHEYEMTKAEIRLWSWKVKSGRTLAGHDYHNPKRRVKEAVESVVQQSDLETMDTENGLGVWRSRVKEK